MGVGGDQLGLAGACGSVDDGVGGVQAVLDGQVPGGEGNGFIKGDDAPVDGLRDEAFSEGAAALLGQMLVDLAENDGREQNRTLVFEVIGKGGGTGVLGKIFKPAR